MKLFWAGFWTVILLLGGNVSTLAQESMLPGPLVSAEWLAENRDDLQVIHISRGEHLFRTSFIPGGSMVPWSAINVTRENDQGQTVAAVVAPPEIFSAAMQEAGLVDDKPVVIAAPGDSAGSMTYATRLYWQMKYYGKDNMAILDGGVRAWTSAGQQTALRPAQLPRGDWQAETPRQELLATSQDVRQALDSKDTVLLDTRDTAQFTGRVVSGSVSRAGHLPDAVNVPYSNVTSATGVALLRPKSTLEALFSIPALDGRPVITYCNSGTTSSLAWFVLSEFLGVEDVSLYDGSMIEWTANRDNPVVMGR